MVSEIISVQPVAVRFCKIILRDNMKYYIYKKLVAAGAFRFSSLRSHFFSLLRD